MSGTTTVVLQGPTRLATEAPGCPGVVTSYSWDVELERFSQLGELADDIALAISYASARVRDADLNYKELRLTFYFTHNLDDDSPVVVKVGRMLEEQYCLSLCSD